MISINIKTKSKSEMNIVKKITILSSLLFLSLCICNCINQTKDIKQEIVTISGKVTDFENIPIDSAVVRIYHSDFTIAYETYTDNSGFYELNNVIKGNYAAMYVIRLKEYPRMDAIPEEDMRLEFWAWNIIADKNLTINPRYHKLELYGTVVFEEYGGRPVLLVYFRPMSVTKNNSYGKDIYLDKSKMEEMNVDLSVSPEYLDVEVYADEEALDIKSIQPIYDYKKEKKQVVSYLLQVDRPKVRPNKPYIIFRIVATNKEYDEKGENLYFFELKNYL